MSKNPPLPGRSSKPGDGYVKKQPPKPVKNLEAKPTPFGLEPIEDDLVLTPEEEATMLDLVQSGGGLEGLKKSAEYKEAIRAARAADGEASSSGVRTTGSVKDIDPNQVSNRSNVQVITKEVAVVEDHYHYVQKLSGVGAAFMFGALSTLITGAFMFNFLLSEGYIRQYFY